MKMKKKQFLFHSWKIRAEGRTFCSGELKTASCFRLKIVFITLNPFPFLVCVVIYGCRTFHLKKIIYTVMRFACQKKNGLFTPLAQFCNTLLQNSPTQQL